MIIYLEDIGGATTTTAPVDLSGVRLTEPLLADPSRPVVPLIGLNKDKTKEH